MTLEQFLALPNRAKFKKLWCCMAALTDRVDALEAAGALGTNTDPDHDHPPHTHDTGPDIPIT